MSTSDEAERQKGRDHITIPPEWEVRDEKALVRAVVMAPAERHEWVRNTLRGIAGEIEFEETLSNIGGADAEILVLHHERAGNALDPRTERSGLMVVVIDAPGDARVAWLRRGADLAMRPGMRTEEAGAQIAALMRRAQVERDRNPLTGMPGNRRLRWHLEAKLADGQTVALVMADIDDFKGYNDRYGHLAGDELILALAGVLREATEAHGGFLAHVGGDDFAVVCHSSVADRIVTKAVEGFGRRREELPGAEQPEVTVVSTTVTPEETGDLQGAFERLAGLRAAAREER